MSKDPIDIAIAWDGVPKLRLIWEEIARRMGASNRPVRKVTVVGLDDLGRRTLASLLGLQRIPHGQKVTLDVARIGSALGLEGNIQLRRFVEMICGPIGNRAAERAATSVSRMAMWERASGRIGTRVPETFKRIRNAGVPDGDIDAFAIVLEQLADSLDHLPSDPPLPLPMLAWNISGNPHSLDADTTCGRYLGLAAIELTGGTFEKQDPDTLAVRGALRELGVIPDRLSTPTTTYGLRAEPSSIVGQLLELGACARMPVHLSSVLLDAGAPHFSQPRWLCVENPSVIEVAALEGCTCPLVCTSGWPSAEAQRLLDLARTQEIELCYAGDYDSAGLAIANFMYIRYKATILMTKDAYLAADFTRETIWAEMEPVPSTPWDPELKDAITTRRRVIYQEDPAVWRRLIQTVATSY